MPHRLSLVFVIIICLSTPLFGDVPILDSTPAAEVPVRLQEYTSFNVRASDPGQHQLSYLWEIVSDPAQLGVRNVSGLNSQTATYAFPWVNDGIGTQPIGSLVRLRVTVSHANPTVDGEASVSYEFNAKVAAVNAAPIPVIKGFFGSPEAPLRPGDAIVCDAGDSIDPDSSGFGVDWSVGFERGGGTFLQRPTPIGAEGTLMTITVPTIIGTGLVELDITAILKDHMHAVRATKTAYMQNGGSSSVNTAPRLVFPQTLSKLTSEQIQITGTVEDLDGDDCEFTWTFLQGSASAMQPIVTVISTSPTRKWQVGGVHAPLPVGNYQVTITAREKNTADHKQTSATVLVMVTNGGGNPPPQSGPPEYSTTESGCDNNTAPELSFSPNVQTAKPIYTSGTPVTIVFSATDSSSIPSPINPNVVSTGTVVEWTDLSQLTALGVNPQTTPSTKDPNMNQKSFSNLTFTAPNHTGTIYLKAKATDVFGCSRTATFGIGFQAAAANTPPIAKIRYQIDGGLITTPSGAAVLVLTNSSHTIALDGTTSTDAEGAIAQYSWSLTGTSGLTLTGSTSASAGFTVPAGFSGSVIVNLTVQDSLSAQNTASLSFNFQAASATAPSARIRYKIGTNGTFGEASGPVTVTSTGSSQSVIFDASTSVNTLTYAWTKEQTLTAGSVTAIGSATAATYTLTVSGSARGTVVVRLTAKNGAGEEGTASVTLNIQGPADQPPVARIKYKIDGGILTAAPSSEAVPVANDATRIITLDGTASTDAEGAVSSYLWTLNDSLAGVALTNATSGTAGRLTINSGTVGVVSVSLTVKDSANQENSSQVVFDINVPAEVPALYFPQIGVGPMPNGQEELRTVLLLVNDTDTDANEVQVEFYTPDGAVLHPLVDGQPWEDEPFSLRAMTSRRITFTNPEIQVGWARVTSDTKLFGLVQYQLVRLEDARVMREISLFSSSPARKLVTFFDRAEDIAVAIANPGENAAKIRVKIVDTNNGETPDLAWHLFPSIPPAGLGKNMQVAKPLERVDVPSWATQGSLVIESDNEVLVTILKTTNTGEAFSTLPISITR